LKRRHGRGGGEELSALMEKERGDVIKGGVEENLKFNTSRVNHLRELRKGVTLEKSISPVWGRRR